MKNKKTDPNEQVNENAVSAGDEVQHQADAAAPVEDVNAKKAAEYLDQLMRLKADFENYRKRVEKQKPEFIAWGKSEVLLKLLPIYDSVIHAHVQLESIMKNEKAACDGTTVELCKGLEMIFREFSKFFESEGIKPMDTLGKPYDPMAHEVLTMVDGDESNEGLVVQEVQKGFVCGDKILRAAKVCVAKKKDNAEQSAQ